MKKYRLYDQISAILIDEYDDKEDAIKEVGLIISHLGIEEAVGRYVLTQKPDRIGNARIVYHAQETVSRALVYFDRPTLEARRKKLGMPGRWAAKA